MQRLIIFASLVMALAVAAPAEAAPKDKPGKPDKTEMREQADRGADARERAEEMAEREREMAEERREEAEEMAKREREMAEERREMGDAATRGSERSQEMRARRDERKEIKAEYREGQPAEAPAAVGDDAEPAPEPEQKKAKKPWWKFWED